jgi:phosphoenolpyruvate-protein kinase (PTS system EI component)
MLLSQSSGVVAQEGGALTHAAITARELNIPAVVACKGVMQTLRDGMRIRVNGTTGEVFILDANDSQSDPTYAS